MTQQGRWLPDPMDPARARWWDGRQWTAQVLRDGIQLHDPLVPRVAPTSPARVPVWLWIVVGLVAVVTALLLWPIALIAASVALVTALIALARSTPTWLRLRSKAAAAIVAAASVMVLAVSGSAMAATATRPATSAVSLVAEASPTSAPRPTSAQALSTAPPTVVEQIVVTEAVAFAETTVDDPNLPQGQTLVTTTGQNGTRTLTYSVTLVDGVEKTRTLVSDVVTVAPVAQVTSVGSYVEPAPEPEPQPAEDAGSGSGCDPNYADACVPIDSDVDCAGGSGNGPSYFSGVARVVGSDVYGLDRDGDGYACNH